MSETALLRLPSSELASGRPYVERAEHAPLWHDEAALALWYGQAVPLWRALGGGAANARAVVRQARAAATELATLDDTQLRQRAQALRRELRAGGFRLVPVARLFAVVREGASRVLGKRHYDCQLQAGWLLDRKSTR